MRFGCAPALLAFVVVACGARTQLAHEENTSDASSSDGTTDACAAISSDLAEKASLAAACCAKCNIVQCTATVEGVCCPLVVSNPNTPAVADYLSALAAYRAAGCAPPCPFGCPAEPKGSCGTNGICPEP